MDGRQNYRSSYELRRVIFFGAVASSSLIVSVLFLYYLGSQVSSHPGYSTDTISEMMGYAEFFLFSYGSYFAAAVIVWSYSDYFSKKTVSWLPIALFGSILFSTSFLLRVWISDLLSYQENDPFRSAPPGFWMVVVSILIVAGACFLMTFIGCAMASSLFTSKHDAKIVPK
ncbi:MAG: hypothetical protein KF831_14555 [Acidobacteria bacterium]|nr:hypothetical protein [Acidobacteriota bacterium]